MTRLLPPPGVTVSIKRTDTGDLVVEASSDVHGSIDSFVDAVTATSQDFDVIELAETVVASLVPKG